MGHCCEKNNIIIRNINFKNFFDKEPLDEIIEISKDQNGKSKYIINFKPSSYQKIKLVVYHSDIIFSTISASIEIINQGNYFPFIYNTDIQTAFKAKNSSQLKGCIKGNIYTTICIPFNMIIDNINDNDIIVKIVCISIYEILSKYIIDKMFLKYPNDILCNDKKRIGETTVESYKNYVLIVFVFNIVDKPSKDKILNYGIEPCCLKEHMRHDTDVPNAMSISIDVAKKIFYNLNLSGDEIFDLYNKYKIKKNVKT